MRSEPFWPWDEGYDEIPDDEPETQRCLIHLEPDVNDCRGCAADRKAAS